MRLLVLLCGRSNSGKSTIFEALKEKIANPEENNLGANAEWHIAKQYTTRPSRETEGDSRYHFVSAEELTKLELDGKVVEVRRYPAAFGDCMYATVDDGTLFPEPTQFHDALCTGNRSGERPKEASDVITIMESQIDAVLDTFRYVQKENENHPDDPYTVACIYLSASTDTLIQRSYERELNYSTEYQNWEEAMRRIVSEIDPKYGSGTPYHPMVQKLLNPKILNEVSNRPNLLQAYDLEGGFFPAPIVEIGGEYYGESLLLRGPLTAPYFDTMVLPPFFYLKVDDCTVEESVTGVTYLIDWMRYHRLTKQEIYLEWAKVVAKPHVLSRSDIACNSLLLRFGSDDLLANCFPVNVKNDQFNYTSGSHDLVEYNIEFRCTKYESMEVNKLAEALLDRYKDLANSLK